MRRVQRFVVLVALVVCGMVLASLVQAAEVAPAAGGSMFLWFGVAGAVGAFIRVLLSPEAVSFSKRSLGDLLMGFLIGVFWDDYSPIQLSPEMGIVKKAIAIGGASWFAGDMLADGLRRAMQVLEKASDTRSLRR